MNADESNLPPRSHEEGAAPFSTVRLLLVVLFLAIPAAGGLLTLLEVKQDDIGGVDGLDGALAAALSPEGGHLYVAGGAESSIAIFARDATNETLTFLAHVEQGVGGVFGLQGVSDLAASRDGRHLYATASLDDTLLTFRRLGGGLLFLPAEVQQDGVGGVFGISGASSLAVSPDGRNIYVSGRSGDAVGVFSRDATTDSVSYHGAETHPSLDGASSVAVSPDGLFVYVSAELSDSLTVYSRDATTDSLALAQVLSDDVGGVDGLRRAEAVAVSPDGKHVYVASPRENAVAIFERPDLGISISGQIGRPPQPALTYVGQVRNGQGGVEGIEGASALTFSSDGLLLFVSGSGENAIGVFNRSETTGELKFLQAVRDGAGGVVGIAGVAGGVSSEALKHLYITGRTHDTLAAFRLEAVITTLDFESGTIDDWTPSP